VCSLTIICGCRGLPSDANGRDLARATYLVILGNIILNIGVGEDARASKAGVKEAHAPTASGSNTR
jgi:hypothetical protein